MVINIRGRSRACELPLVEGAPCKKEGTGGGGEPSIQMRLLLPRLLLLLCLRNVVFHRHSALDRNWYSYVIMGHSPATSFVTNFS